jgi:FkbM family methyltransferase|tara:strand:- start:1126 stop:1959 length:834 start_codon:yes stop_codon:yes gene_type:complete
MQNFKKLIFYIIEKSNFLAKNLHKIWMFYTSIKCFIKLYLYKYTSIKIKSLSDRGQDIWVVELFHSRKEDSIINEKSNENKISFKRKFFLEIGAGDGFFNSNTFILEKNYNWTGILVEPDPEQFAKLKKNRRSSCILSNDLIWNKKEKINFFQNGELSKVVINKNDTLKKNNNYLKLNAISLEELLKKYNAPKIIDFFSLDVEGSEEQVLIPCIKEYIFLSLTIERPSLLLNSCLIANDYFFIKNSIYDSFYVHKSISNFNEIKKYSFSQLPAKRYI